MRNKARKRILKNKESAYRRYISLSSVNVHDSDFDASEFNDETKLVEVYSIPREMFRKDIKRAEEEIRNQDVEHAFVYTRRGIVYHFEGTDQFVNVSSIGRKNLEGAIAVHNHTNLNGPSRGDFLFSVLRKIRETRVVGPKNTFVFKVKPNQLDLKTAEFFYLWAEENSMAKEGDEPVNNMQDLTMKELCRLASGCVEYEKE